MQILYPKVENSSIDVVLNRIQISRNTHSPFSEPVIEFLDSLSRKLFQVAREMPTLAPLAFFIRRAHSHSLRDSLANRIPVGKVSTPQGAVFHIPPTNVDTLFLYTLSLALLSGNSNIVRISNNASPETFELLEVVFDTLQEHPIVAPLVTFVSFDRDIEVLEAISLACDVRMIWGGDQTINSIRKTPVAVHSKDLAFPDRLSLAAIDCDYWHASSENEKILAVEKIYNDSFWFDQMACSSPQHIVFVTDDAMQGTKTENELMRLLDEYTQTKYKDADGQAINKMVAVIKALEIGATKAWWLSNSIVSVQGIDLKKTDQIRPGGGFFTTQKVSNLNLIIDQMMRKVQTLTYFGFSYDELSQFASFLNGRGIDRIVPIGQALDFDEIWDGKDLLMELHRLTSIH
jgi:hypothetical protein